METTLPPTDYPTRGRVAAGLVAGLLFLLPVARYDGFLYPHFSLLVLFHLAVLALLLIWAFPVRAAAPRSSGSYSAQILLGAYALVSVASCFWAPDRRLSAIGSIPIVFGVIWALLLAQLLRDPRDVRLILRGAFLAGTLAALSASYYVLREGQISFVEKVLGHRNFLAIFLLPPILFGLADLFSPILVPGARRDSVLGLPDVVVSVCVALMILALLMCKSWGALLGLAAGAICLLACRLSWQKRAYILFGAIGLVVVGLAVLSLPSISARLIKHAQATRWFMWQGALRMIADRPLLGWGSGMFMPYFADYKPTAPMEYGWLTVITIYPHNELLLVVAEGGMLALALYVGAFGVAMRNHLSATESAEERSRRVVGWAVFASFVAMTVHGLVSVALRFWAPYALYWTLLGLMLAWPRLGQQPSRQKPSVSTVRLTGFSAAVVIVILLLWGVVWCEAKAEWLMSGALKKSMSAEQVSARFAEAAKLSRYVPDYFIALVRRATVLRQSGKIDQAIEVYEEVERKAPGYGAHGSTRRHLGKLYLQRVRGNGKRSKEARDKDLKRATEVLGRAVKQNPYNWDARLALAHALAATSRDKLPLALEQVHAVLEGQPEKDQAEAYALLGGLLPLIGKKKEALAAMNRARSLCDPRKKALFKQISEARNRLLKELEAAGERKPAQPPARP